MKTFKDFMDEETGGVPGNVTGTGGGSNIGNEPATAGPKRGKHPYHDLVRRQAKVPAVPVTPPTFMTKEESELFEDDKKDQRKRDKEDKSIPATKFATSDKNEKKNDPFSSERESAIKKMTSHIEEENDRYFRDKSGKLRLKPEYASQETPGWKRMPGGLQRKAYTGIDRSKFVKASEHPDIVASQKKKLETAEAKKREKEVKDRVQNLKLLRQLEKIQKERGTLHQTLMRKK